MPNPDKHTCLHETDFTLLNKAITRIEEALGQLVALLESTATLEERTQSFKEDLEDIAVRLRTVELAVATASGSSVWSDRIIALLIGAGVTLLINHYK